MLPSTSFLIVFEFIDYITFLFRFSEYLNGSQLNLDDIKYVNMKIDFNANIEFISNTESVRSKHEFDNKLPIVKMVTSNAEEIFIAPNDRENWNKLNTILEKREKIKQDEVIMKFFNFKSPINLDSD